MVRKFEQDFALNRLEKKFNNFVILWIRIPTFMDRVLLRL